MPTLAAKAATATIPIVFSVGEDPVKLGLVASLARPGGNVTGINIFLQEAVAKRLRLLHELVPKAVRIAVLINPGNASFAETTVREVQKAAPTMGLQIQILKATTISEIDAAFATLARERLDALLVAGDTLLDQPPRTHCHFDGARQDSGGLSGPRACGGRRADELRNRPRRTRFVNSVSIPAVSSKAQSPPTCRCCSRPNSSLSSTSRLPRRSASPFLRACFPSPTR